MEASGATASPGLLIFAMLTAYSYLLVAAYCLLLTAYCTCHRASHRGSEYFSQTITDKKQKRKKHKDTKTQKGKANAKEGGRLQVARHN